MANNSLNSGFGVRRLGSPSGKNGPMKATVQFTLVQGSPTRGINGKKSSPASSPVPLISSGKSRKSPDNRLSPEDGSAGFKVLRSPIPVLYRRSGSLDRHAVERPKPIRPTAGHAGIKRTSSLDTIAVPYLTGQWPRGDYQIQHPAGPEHLDKTTQTPDEWEDLLEEKRRRKGSAHKRSSSVGNNGANDNLKEMIKARLAKTKEKTSNTQRTSPIQASHLPFISAVSGGSFIQTKAVAIPISHNSIRTFSPIRIRNSVEGLNQEIESALGNSKEFHRSQEPTPDGHRAPILELMQPGSSHHSNHPNNSSSNPSNGSSTTTSTTPAAAAITRTVDTQTPSQIIDSLSLNELSTTSSDSGSGSSRPPSTSPTIPIIPAGGMECSPRGVGGGSPRGVTGGSPRGVGGTTGTTQGGGGGSSPRPPSRCTTLSADYRMDDTPQDRLEVDGEEMETISPDDLLDNLLEKCAPSPRPNKTFSFAREPPDGCEKVKIIDEPRRVPTLKEPLLYCPLLKEGPPLIPSTVSAFCPLSKAYHHSVPGAGLHRTNSATNELLTKSSHATERNGAITGCEFSALNRSSSHGDISRSPVYTDHQGNRSPSNRSPSNRSPSNRSPSNRSPSNRSPNYSPSNNNYAASSSHGNGRHGSNNNNVRSSPLELP